MKDPLPTPRIPVPFLKWRGFTLRVFLFTIIPILIIILAIVFLSQYLHYREMRMMVADRNLRSVRLAADNIAQQIREKQEMLLLYEKSMSEKEQFPDLSTFFDEGIGLFDLSSNQFLPVSATLETISVDPEIIKLWNSLAVQTPAPPITIHGKDKILSFISVRSENDTIVIGIFDTQKMLKASVTDLMAAANVSIWVEDLNFELLYQATTSAADIQKPALDPAGEMQNHSMDGITILPDRNGDQVISYAPIDHSDWTIIYAETWGNIASSLINTTFYVPFILIPLFVIAVITLWFGARQIVIPLQKLQGQSVLLGRGDFEAIEEPVGGIAEIQQLQKQLIQVSRELQLVQGNLHQYIGSITAGVEKERHNLARELHDDTLQSLIALQQRVQMAEMRQDESRVENFQDLQTLKDLVQKSIQNLRRLVRGLRPAYLDDFGLISAAKILIEEMRSGQSLEITVQVEGMERRLPANVELAFYRIIQEALSNTIRHANATQAMVRFSFSATEIVLMIADNGAGFRVPDQVDAFASSGHFGLLGISERADLVGAALEIFSSAENGTKLIIRYRWDTSASI